MAALLDGVDDALLLIDEVGNLGFCNRAAMRLLGAEPGQGLVRLEAALGPQAGAWLRARRQDPEPARRDLDARLADGRGVRLSAWREARQLALRVLLLPGAAAAAAGAGARAEVAELPLAPGPTQQVLALLWASPFPATLQDAQHRLVAVNDAYLDFTGRTREALLGTDPLLLMPPEDRDADRPQHREPPPRHGFGGPLLHEQRLVDAAGRERWCRAVRYAVSGDGGARLVLSVLQDTTAEHVARAQADRSLDELAQWFDLSPTGMLVFDDTGLILRSNRAFEALAGQLPVALGDAPAELQALLGFDAGAPREALRNDAALPEQQTLLALPDGRLQRLSARVRSLPAGGGRARFMAVVEDRSAEEERDLAQLEIGALMDAAGVGVATFDGARGWLRPRPERRRAAARQPGLQAIAREMVEPESLAAYEQLQQALRRGERTEVRYAVRHGELGRRWLLTRVEPDDAASGRRTVVTVDVTEQEAARAALQQQAERTRAILDSVLVGIVTVGPDGIEWMNRSARRMFGGDLAHFQGRPLAVVATAEPDHPLRTTAFPSSLVVGQSRSFECRLKARDGREFWVVGNAVLTVGDGGTPQITVALLDIERRRQAEVSIAQAQASLQRIIETAPLAIALFDAASQRLLQLNQMAAAFFGRPLAALAGRTLLEALGDDPVVRLGADLSAARADAEVLRRELQRPGRGGSVRWWDIRVVSLPGSAAGGEQVLLVASDVTEQRAEAERRFEAAIAQREMLVKEVHHRIKNNLQGVAGLLQHHAARRPEVAAVLTESVGQVQAIAQIHGLQVGAGGPLRLASVLEAIAQTVQRTFGRPVAVQIDGDAPRAFVLPEAESIPIALTVNELLTNAVKHGGEGEVRCSLQAEGDAARLSILSPGALPPGFDLALVPGGVSGLGLVRALLPRRSATLTLCTQGAQVQAQVLLRPPGVARAEG